MSNRLDSKHGYDGLDAASSSNTCYFFGHA
jgi:hypothetical protein